MEEEKTNIKKMGAVQFWIRLAVWLVLSVAAPFTFVGIKYGLFADSAATTKVSGWGIVAFTVLGITLVGVIRSARKGLHYASMGAQVIDGITVLIPLAVLIIVIDLVKKNIDAFEEFLIFTIICEAVAVPVNPMRRWGFEHNVEGMMGIAGSLLGKFFDKKEK